jgi:hypothetical protein
MPQNGAAPTQATAAPAPTGTQAPGAAPPASAPDYQALHAKAEQRAAALEARVQQAEKDRLDRLKADKAKEREAEERRKQPLHARLQAEYGDDWYDVVTKAKTGTVAPAHVSAALSEHEQGLKSYIDEQLKPLREENAQLKRESAERTRQEYAAKAAAYAKENAAKYELVNRYKQADNLGPFIESHYGATGEVWTHEQAAAELEKYWAGVREMVLKSENGRQLADTMGTTPKPFAEQRPEEPAAAPLSESQRRKRLEDAFAAMQAKQRQSAQPN